MASVIISPAQQTPAELPQPWYQPPQPAKFSHKIVPIQNGHQNQDQQKSNGFMIFCVFCVISNVIVIILITILVLVSNAGSKAFLCI